MKAYNTIGNKSTSGKPSVSEHHEFEHVMRVVSVGANTITLRDGGPSPTTHRLTDVYLDLGGLVLEKGMEVLYSHDGRRTKPVITTYKGN